MAAMPTVKTLKRGTVVQATCVHCQAALEYLPLSSLASDEPFHLECAQCGKTWIKQPPKPRPTGKRRIGTGAHLPPSPPRTASLRLTLPLLADDKPLETEYYDVSVQSSR